MENGKELDVYAEPYIPLILKQVNTAPARQVACLPAPWIDFDTYVAAFAGNFLTARPRPTLALVLLQASAAATALDDKAIELDELRYGHFFSALLAVEILALQNECQKHNLYRVPLLQAVSTLH